MPIRGYILHNYLLQQCTATNVEKTDNETSFIRDTNLSNISAFHCVPKEQQIDIWDGLGGKRSKNYFQLLKTRDS